MKGLVMTAAGRIQVEEREWLLPDMQRLVGGYVECLVVGTDTEPALMWLNEEGKLENLPENKNATLLAKDVLFQGDYIAGDVVVLGAAGEHNGPVPAWVLERYGLS